MSEPRVLIVDDHQLFRAGVRSELDPLLDVVGEAGGVAEAVDAIRELAPEVVLLDVHMPDGGGVEVIRRTAAELERPPRFLALSVSDAAEDVIAVIRAGARGYVTKNISGDELADAVRRVQGGDAVFSPRLAGFVLDAFAGPGAAARVRARRAHAARARGAPAHRARLHVQGDRSATRHLAEDGRGARVVGAAQAAALEPARAVALGRGARARPVKLGVRAALADGVEVPGDVEVARRADRAARGVAGRRRRACGARLRRPPGQRLRGRRLPDGRAGRLRRRRGRARRRRGHRLPAHPDQRAAGRAARRARPRPGGSRAFADPAARLPPRGAVPVACSGAAPIRWSTCASPTRRWRSTCSPPARSPR